jgi:hypothetical protein
MDAREYISKIIKPDTVRDSPIQARIVNVFVEERYNRPCLELETGAEFPLNAGNTTALIKAFGHETDDWVGHEVELFLGTYKDYRADPVEEKETVRVRAAEPANAVTPTPANPGANGGTPIDKSALPTGQTAAAKGDDMNDSIPF